MEYDSDSDDDDTCPTCIEEFDQQDKKFYPCPCKYRVCMFCVRRIQTEFDGRCPGCRRDYNEDDFSFLDVSASRSKTRKTKRNNSRANHQETTTNHLSAAAAAAALRKRVSAANAQASAQAASSSAAASAQQRNAAGAGAAVGGAVTHSSAYDSEPPKVRGMGTASQQARIVDRKRLANIRVVQRNLLYVIGLAPSLANESLLSGKDYFGQYGRVLKVVVKVAAQGGGAQTLDADGIARGNSSSAYITFQREDDAKYAIQAVDGFTVDGHAIRASFGTTKYCNMFLRNMPCNNPDCLYLHKLGDDAASFTKEEMQGMGGGQFHDMSHVEVKDMTSLALKHASVLPPRGAVGAQWPSRAELIAAAAQAEALGEPSSMAAAVMSTPSTSAGIMHMMPTPAASSAASAVGGSLGIPPGMPPGMEPVGPATSVSGSVPAQEISLGDLITKQRRGQGKRNNNNNNNNNLSAPVPVAAAPTSKGLPVAAAWATVASSRSTTSTATTTTTPPPVGLSLPGDQLRSSVATTTSAPSVAPSPSPPPPPELPQPSRVDVGGFGSSALGGSTTTAVDTPAMPLPLGFNSSSSVAGDGAAALWSGGSLGTGLGVGIGMGSQSAIAHPPPGMVNNNNSNNNNNNSSNASRVAPIGSSAIGGGRGGGGFGQTGFTMPASTLTARQAQQAAGGGQRLGGISSAIPSVGTGSEKMGGSGASGGGSLLSMLGGVELSDYRSSTPPMPTRSSASGKWELAPGAGASITSPSSASVPAAPGLSINVGPSSLGGSSAVGVIGGRSLASSGGAAVGSRGGARGGPQALATSGGANRNASSSRSPRGNGSMGLPSAIGTSTSSSGTSSLNNGALGFPGQGLGGGGGRGVAQGGGLVSPSGSSSRSGRFDLAPGALPSRPSSRTGNNSGGGGGMGFGEMPPTLAQTSSYPSTSTYAQSSSTISGFGGMSQQQLQHQSSLSFSNGFGGLGSSGTSGSAGVGLSASYSPLGAYQQATSSMIGGPTQQQQQSHASLGFGLGGGTNTGMKQQQQQRTTLGSSGLGGAPLIGSSSHNRAPGGGSAAYLGSIGSNNVGRTAEALARAYGPPGSSPQGLGLGGFGSSSSAALGGGGMDAGTGFPGGFGGGGGAGRLGAPGGRMAVERPGKRSPTAGNTKSFVL